MRIENWLAVRDDFRNWLIRAGMTRDDRIHAQLVRDTRCRKSRSIAWWTNTSTPFQNATKLSLGLVSPETATERPA